MVCTEACINWLKGQYSNSACCTKGILKSPEKKIIGLGQTKWPANTVLAIKTDWKIRGGRDQKSITQSQHAGNEG